MKRLGFLFLFLSLIQKSFCGGYHEYNGNSHIYDDVVINVVMQLGETKTFNPLSDLQVSTNDGEGGCTSTDYEVSNISAFDVSVTKRKWYDKYDLYKVKALKAGSYQFKGIVHYIAKIYSGIGLTIYGKSTATYNITVVEVTSINIPSTLSMDPGDENIINPVITDSRAKTTLTWSSSNESVATVTDGKIQAKSAGTTNVTCRASNGVSASCVVTVRQVPVTGIILPSTTIEIEKGGLYELAPTIIPSNATNQKVVWSSSNSNVATITEILTIRPTLSSTIGVVFPVTTVVVQAVNSGTATITGYAADGGGATVSCTVNVTEEEQEMNIPITQISISDDQYKALTIGQSTQLSAIILPENASDKSVTWSSSNSSIATVNSDGLVKAVGIGSATIKCRANDGSGVTATCVIDVFAIFVSKIELSISECSLEKGETKQLNATINPNNATNKSVIWVSSNTSVANVDNNGLVTAIEPGAATIICKALDGSNVQGTCIVTVTPKKVQSISLNVTSLTLNVEESYQLTATANPSDASNIAFSWSSSNFDVANVDENGLVTAMERGETYITCTALDGSGVKATCKVTVTSIPVSGISLNHTSYTIGETNTLQLIANVSPSNAGNRDISWSSSNTAIATVDEKGLVTAQGKGTTIITCASCDGSGVSATCEVKVPMVYVTDFTLNKTLHDMEIGETFQLIATVKPSNATYQVLSWSSNTPNVVSVSNNGLISATGAGQATITCTVSDGQQQYFASPVSLSTTCIVTVRNQQQEIIGDIVFADAEVKRICVENWDSNNDGELSYNEAETVTSLGNAFKENDIIESFLEFQYFKGLTDNNSLATAFYNCNKLKEISIPSSLNSIGRFAFYGCNSLEHIDIPNNIVTIEDGAFSQCFKLEFFDFPESLVSIGSESFCSCHSLRTIAIKSNVSNIHEKAFKMCDGIESITVSNTNNTFDSRNNCNAIIETANNKMVVASNNTIVPDDIIIIGNNAFYGRRTESTLLLPVSVTSIGDYAFASCDNLESFVIPENVTQIGEYSFGMSQRLKMVAIPAKVSSIGHCAFYNTPQLATVIFENEEPVSIDENTFTNRINATLYVPNNSISAYKVADYWKEFQIIGGIASKENVEFVDAEVKRLCVENWDTNGDGELSYVEAAAVTDLGEVFKSSKISSFEELQYFTGLNEIGENAFSYSSISQVTLPEGLSTIKRSAFADTNNLKTIDFPSSLQEIETNAFFYGGLTQIVIPKTITKIGIEPFFACPIETITVDSENAYYDSRENCHALIETATNRLIVGTADAFIPNTVASIGGGAFYGGSNRNRASLEIPSSVVNIGRCILRGNTVMTSLHIPASVKTIDQEAFNGVENLSTITVDPGNTNYDSRNDCNAIIETATNTLIRGSIAATIPDGVEKISSHAYYENNLTSVVIPNSVREIGYQSFAFCYKLKSIEIPNSVTSIGSSAFSYSPNVEVIKVHIRQPFTISDRCFTGFSSYAVKENATLYVPFGTKSLYEQTDGWKDFKNIVEMEIDPDSPIDFADDEVKRICVENWDSNGDGELSYEEAAAVTDLGTVFKSNRTITSFNELAYFTNLNEIPSEAFYYCLALQSVVFPEECTSIGNSSFYSCEKLQSINIPSAVSSIGSAAFGSCKDLATITVSLENEIYDSRNNCNAIIHTGTNTLIAGCKNTVIPNDIVSIGEFAFRGVTGLNEITIPHSVASIERFAFIGCNLASLIIPSSVTSITDYTFSGSTMSSIVVEDGNPVYDSREGCNAIIETATNTLVLGCQTTRIPSSIKKIGDYSFISVKTLTELVIPEGVSSIGSQAFAYTPLTMISLPKTLEEIGSYAFYGCNDLLTIYSYNSQPPVLNGNEVFIKNVSGQQDYIFQHATLYVPKGSKSAYIASNGWNNFQNIVEMEPVAGYTQVGEQQMTLTVEEMKFQYSHAKFNIDKTVIASALGCNSDDIVEQILSSDGTLTDQANISPTIWGLNNIMISVDYGFWYNSEGYSDDYPTGVAAIVAIENEPSTYYLIQVPNSYHGGDNYSLDYYFTYDNKYYVYHVQVNVVEKSIKRLSEMTKVGGQEIVMNEDLDTNYQFVPFDVDWEAITESLGCEQGEIIDMALNADGELDYESTATPCGFWFNAEGYVDKWGINAVMAITKESTYGIIQYPNALSSGESFAVNYYLTYEDKYYELNVVLNIADDNVPANQLTAQTEGVLIGEKAMLTIDLSNEEDIIMAEAYLSLPEGISVAMDENGKFDASLSSRKKDHALTVAKDNEGNYHFLCYSSSNATLKGNEGVVINVRIECDETVSAGSYEATLKRILMKNAARVEITNADYTFDVKVLGLQPGDVNGSGSVNGSDVVDLVDKILDNPVVGNFYVPAADMNADGKVNGMDLVRQIAVVMSQSSSQHAPAMHAARRAPVMDGESLTLTTSGNDEMALGVASGEEMILMQCVVELTDGLQLVGVATDDAHAAIWQPLGNHCYSVLVYSPSNATFTSSNAMLHFRCKGEGAMSVREVLLVDDNRQEHWLDNANFGDITGIEVLSGAELQTSGSAVVYDFGGRKRSDRALKGIYIINGKKIVNR